MFMPADYETLAEWYEAAAASNEVLDALVVQLTMERDSWKLRYNDLLVKTTETRPRVQYLVQEAVRAYHNRSRWQRLKDWLLHG